MKIVRVINRTRGTEIAASARVADNFLTRLRGLLYSRPLSSGEGLLLKPCNSIHMFGMAYPIDAIFIHESKVVGLVERIQPMQTSKSFRMGANCLEVPAGTISDTATQVGDEFSVEAVE